MPVGAGCGLGRRWFCSLSKSPTLAYLWGRDCSGLTLKGLAVNFENAGTAQLPHFPALRELTPMKLKTFHAGASQITDHSPEIPGKMTSLEGLEFWQCLKLTGAGVGCLSSLPNLKEITLAGLPPVTVDVTTKFPASVSVIYS